MLNVIAEYQNKLIHKQAKMKDIFLPSNKKLNNLYRRSLN